MSFQVDYARAILIEQKDKLLTMSESEQQEFAASLLNSISTKKEQPTPEALDELQGARKRADERMKGIESRHSPEAMEKLRDVRGGREPDYVSDAQKRVQLQELGVVTDQDLPVGDWKLGFGVDPQTDVKNVLSKEFETDVTVFKSDSDMFYIDPSSRKPIKINPSWGAKAGLALPLVGDVGGTVAMAHPAAKYGAGVKTMIGAETVGAGVGSAIGEGTRLAIGKAFGVHDIPNSEILERAKESGKEAALWTAGIGSVVGTIKGIKNLKDGRVFTPKDFEKYGYSAKEAEDLFAEVNQILKQGGGEGKVKGTLWDKTHDPEVGSMQRQLEQTAEHGKDIILRKEADQAASSEALDIISRPQVKPYSGTDDAGAIAKDRVIKRKQKIDALLTKNQDDLQKSLDDISGMSHQDVGEDTLDYILLKREAADQSQKKAWKSVEGVGGYDETSKIFNIDIPEGEGVKLFKRIEKARSKAAKTPEGKARIFLDEPKGKQPRRPAQDLAQFNHELSALRTKLGEIKSGKQYSNISIHEYKNAISAMEKDRRKALYKAGKKDVMDAIEIAEKQTTEFYETYQRSVVGDLLELNKNGVPKIQSRDFVEKMAKMDKAEVDQFQGAISDNMELLGKWKEGLADLYRDKAFDVTTGKFNRKASQTFFKDNKEMISRWFNEKEVERFIDKGTFAEHVAKSAKRMEAFKKKASEKWGTGAISKVDTDGLTKFITAKGSWINAAGQKVKSKVEKVKFVKNMTFDNPAAFQKLQNEYRSQLKTEILDLKTGKINPSKIANLVENPANADLIKEALGTKYFNNLQKINGVIQQLNKQPVQFGVEETRKGLFQAFRAGFAPPLTRRGRAFTAAVTFDSKMAHNRIARAILDEKTMAEVAELGEHSAYTRQFFEKAFSLGFALPDENEE